MRAALVVSVGIALLFVLWDRRGAAMLPPAAAASSPSVAAPRDVSLASGPSPVPMRIALSDDLRCGRLVGTLRDADGTPVTRYRIRLGRDERKIEDSEGRFELYAKWGSEGTLWIREVGRLHRFGTYRVDCASQELALQLPRLGALTVRVWDSAGVSIDVAAVYAELDLPDECLEDESRTLFRRQKTEGGTTFRAQLGPGRYRVTAIAHQDPSNAGSVGDLESRFDDFDLTRLDFGGTTTTVHSDVEQSLEIVISKR